MRTFGTTLPAKREGGDRVGERLPGEWGAVQTSSTPATSLIRIPGQSQVWLLSVAHGATHWVIGTFYILLPFVTKDLGLSYTESGLMVSTYYVTSLVATMTGGILVDVTGRRVLFQVVALLFGAAAIVGFGVAGALVVLAAMAGLIGIGNNLWHPAAISFLSQRFPANRGYVLSIHAMFANLGEALAPAVAGLMLLVLSWRETSVLAAVPSLLCAVLVATTLRRMTASSGGGRSAMMDRRTYARGIRQLMASRVVMGITVAAAFRSMTQTGVMMFLPLYLANGLKVSPAMLGATLMAMQVGGLIAGPVAGIASDRVGRRPVVMVCLAVATGLVVLVGLIGNIDLFVGCISVLGFALFAVRPVMQGWMMDVVPPQLAASGTSLLFSGQAVLSMVTPVAGGFIADRWGLGIVFYFLAGTIFVANLAVLALPRDMTPLSAGG
jgi:MFS family permease